MKKIIMAGIILILVIVAVIFNKKKSHHEEYEQASVKQGEVRQIIDVDGQMLPGTYADISTEIPTTVSRVMVKNNELVSKGQVLFYLDKKSISAQIRQAQLAVEKAELAERKARRNWDDLKSEDKSSIKKTTEQARQALNEVYAQAAKTTIVSPIDGTVVRQDARVGEIARGVVMRVVDLDSLRMEALIPEVDISRVRVGNAVRIVFDAYPQTDLFGKISSIDIGETKQANNIYYRAIVTMDNLDKVQELHILEGMNADVYVITKEKKDVLVIPRDFAKKDEKGYFVLIRKENSANNSDSNSLVKKYFQTGLVGENNIEVQGGLRKDEQVFKVVNLNNE